MKDSHVPVFCEDVVLCILSWLPVVSLLRFKSVCKSWRSLIERPDFIHQHALNPQISDDDGKLLVFNFSFTNLFNHDSNSNNFRLYSGKYFQSSRILMFKDSIGFSTSAYPESIISSFNGIICLQSFDPTNVYLWNPLTKQFKSLPSPHCPHKENMYCKDYNCGFGFDAKTRDYKVVIMLVDHCDKNLVKNPIEIYSLRTNSWRIIDAVLPVHYIQSTPKSPLFNGGIYCWLGHYDTGDAIHLLILSFDFSTEMFHTMSVPDIYSYFPLPPLPHLDLALLSGKIALTERIHSNVGDIRKVWVLHDYGVKESWNNLYTLRLDSLHFFSYGFSNNGKMILGRKDRDTLESSLSLCDPATQEVTVISSKEVIQFETHVAAYKESLVSIISANDTCTGAGKKTFEELSKEESSSEDDEYDPRA